MARKLFCVATLLIISVFFSLTCALAVEDGFSAGAKTEGKYFTVYYSSGLDSAALAKQLNVSPTERIIVGESASGQYQDLSALVDTLFLEVCNILDMQVYSFHGSIKICRSKSQLASVYRNLFDAELGPMKSFYASGNNTVYVSAEDFRREIIGHEIAHTIIAHYFVVSPPVKIQEVLAGYVEYQLRKNSRSH